MQSLGTGTQSASGISAGFSNRPDPSPKKVGIGSNRTLGGSDAQQYNQSLKQTEKYSHAVRSATKMLVTEYGHVDHALSAILNKTDQWNAKLAESRAAMREEFKSMAIGGIAAGAGLYKFFHHSHILLIV